MLTNFSLTHYRLTLEALEPLHLSPLKGSALRGGFGHTFKRLVCAKSCGQYCQLGNACPYGYIFETRPPADTEVLSTFSEIPRPFIITSPPDRRSHIPAGESLTFELTLVGRGSNFLPYFVLVFEELGRIGLGRTRGRYRLQTVDSYQPAKLITPKGLHADIFDTPIYRATLNEVYIVDTLINGSDIAAYANTWPTDRLTIEFITPTRLKHHDRWVQTGPPFQVLVKALLGRISSLSYFHGGFRLEADFRGLIDRAAQVAIVATESAGIQWQDWVRFSGRQQQRIEMGGLVGRATYQGDLAEYLPLLALGEFVHVGKGTVFGNGQYLAVRE